jgi:hypothetical protein
MDECELVSGGSGQLLKIKTEVAAIMKNNKKPGTTKVKKTKVSDDVEYSGNITPSAGRLKEADYGKSMDLELAEFGQNQALTEGPIDNTRSDNGQARHHFEIGETDTQNHPSPDNPKFNPKESGFNPKESGFNPKESGFNPKESGFTGFDTGAAGEPAETHDFNETEKKASSKFEFGSMNNVNKKNKLPTPKAPR